MKNLSGTAKGWIEQDVSISNEKPLQIEKKPLDLSSALTKVRDLSDCLEETYKEHKNKDIHDAIILLTMAEKSLKN